MRNLFALLIPVVLLSCNQPTRYKEELRGYVHFLGRDHKLAKDYVLDLFEENDLVILCERDHRENTQYEFLNELISDSRFIKNVGHVFTEVGMRSLNPEINDFLHDENMSDTSKHAKIIKFQRKCSFYPLWDKYNFYFQLNAIYNINRKLGQSEKVNLYLTDVELKTDSFNVDYLKEFWHKKASNRDRLMADYIVDCFEKIKNSKTKRKKALIIMNYRHSFNDKLKQADGSNFDNVGRFLFERYKGKIANVLINPLGILEGNSDVEISWRPLQNGKWDAAFKASNKNNIGFDFHGSPFGKDAFDYWTFTPHESKYQDVFTGFVYYKSPSDFKIITGVDGLIDASFLEIYKKRVLLWKQIVGDRLGNQTVDSLIFKEYSNKNISEKENINEINAQINSWLE